MVNMNTDTKDCIEYLYCVAGKIKVKKISIVPLAIHFVICLKPRKSDLNILISKLTQNDSIRVLVCLGHSS